MATHVIGLDIGTHAARAVELRLGRGRPTVRRMGQVALPPGAVVTGEVVEPAAVAEALKRLWREAGFTSREVVVGVANPRVVARTADLPALPEDELRSSLRYQVQDLVPIPLDEAELDVQVIEHHRGPDGAELVRVLLVAAHRDMLRSLLAALGGAGLTATRIDLIPFALIRALHVPSTTGLPTHVGQEVIVGSGAGVTNVVVHDDGVPRFVRTLPSGGAAVTDALAAELGIGTDDAETVKRGIGAGSYAADTPQVDAVAQETLLPLADEVAGSLDFHLAQVGHADLQRVIVSGGASRLRALRSLLQEQLGVPVVDGDPYARLDLSVVPLDAAVVAASSDLFAVAIGLALADDERSHISLLPAAVAEERAQRRQLAVAVAGVGAVALLLGGLAAYRTMQVDDARAAADAAEARGDAIAAEVATLGEVEQLRTQLDAGAATVTRALQGDVAWTDLLRGMAAAMPPDVWLSSWRGSRLDGAVQLAASGADHPSVARWLQQTGEVTALTAPWVSSSARSDEGVQFAATALLTEAAASDRAPDYGADR